MSLFSDTRASAARAAALRRYAAETILTGDGRFICRQAADCRQDAICRGANFWEGQLSYVGPHYEMTDSGRPLRVLVAPLECGHGPSHVSMKERSTAVRRLIGQPELLNQHMKGVLLALQLAFGKEPSDDEVGRWITTSAGRIHLLDAYAMANMTLCSASGHGKKTMGSPRMHANCSPHMRATVRLLHPTLIVSQGAALAKPRGALASAFRIEERHSDQVVTATCEGARFAWVALHHPSRGNWPNSRTRYFREVAEDALRMGREVALSLSSTRDAVAA